MLRITAKEYSFILDAISHKHGPGYSDDKEIGTLQAKLSIMAQAAYNVETAMAVSAKHSKAIATALQKARR